jgi:hypothetical protein
MSTSILSRELAGRTPLSIAERVFAYVVLIILLVFGYWVSEEQPYTPSSDLGYYMGLAGGLMMLSLLLYPLRKYSRRLANFGALRSWFLVHMIFGICGPILVLFHSTFHIGSFNGGAAFWCMVVVAISGIVGRFVYLHVYYTLGDRQAYLWELERYLKKRADKSRHALDLSPHVRKWLEQYRDHAFATRAFRWDMIARLVPVRSRWRYVSRRCCDEATAALTKEAAAQNWPREKLLGEVRAIRRLIEGYIHAVDNTAPLTFWARVLAWWQIAHVPLIYVLVLSAIAHVVAVHAY